LLTKMLTMSRRKRSKPGWKLSNEEIVRKQKTLQNMLLWKRLTKTEKRRKEWKLNWWPLQILN
jgi:hypothetical protein